MSREAENIEAFLRSGIIENYVLGLATEKDCKRLEDLAQQHIEVGEAIDDFSRQVEAAAFSNAVEPPVTLKPLVMATLDYINRLENGEPASFPPLLNENSTAKDYNEWLERPDMIAGENFEDIFVKLIGYTPVCTTAVVWIKSMAPQEVHDDEHERFLILEGTCTITISGIDHELKAGDYLAIPLHQNHLVTVTSNIPCKVLLQRIAA